MEASRVTITPTTRKAQEKSMKNHQVGKRRTKQVIKFIRSMPTGVGLRYDDLISSTGLNPKHPSERSIGYQLISRLVKQGVILRNPAEKPATYTFVVAEDVVRVIRPLQEYDTLPEPQESTNDIVPAEKSVDLSIEQQAKDFFWQTQSDSLREFVSWINKSQDA